MSEIEWTWGVTKLRNEIYVLFRTGYFVRNVSRIRVFEDRYPFCLQTDIEAEEIKYPLDIVSSEKENCLYVIGGVAKCVWKITRETNDQHKIIKWLTIYYEAQTLSVSRDGELLMINNSTHSLMIYGSDAELIRSIPLTRDIKNPQHAVETSIGNFIIIDRQENVKDKDKDEDDDEDEDEDEDEEKDKAEAEEEEMDEDEEDEVDEAEEEVYEEEEEDVLMEEGKHTEWLENRQLKSGSKRRKRQWVTVVSELTRDGQMVIRHFIPSNQTQQVVDYSYLSTDSDDRVFLADIINDRVILLDSDLKWNRNLCPTSEEKKEQVLMGPRRLFYDEEMKQLIIAGFLRSKDQVNVYTLSLN